tara:strand:- start:3239 stop:4957 length:1719 start_codon:yes stop_codon:yes gene_type:complete
MFSIYYNKNNNSKLFEHLEKHDFEKVQNFVPLYLNYFNLDEKNYNSINLNQRFNIQSILKQNSNNCFNITCLDNSNNKIKVDSFFKFSPLLDPVKFMVGKYKNITKETMTKLPQLNNDNIHAKVLDKNNSAYVDSFFSYLTSQLYHKVGFTHGLDFYGSFLGIKNELKLNVYDDLEYLFDSDFFHKQKNQLFDMDDIDEERLIEGDTRNYRKKIVVESEDINVDIQTIDDKFMEEVFELTQENLEKHNNELKEEYSVLNNKNLENKSEKRSNSTCSSRTSNTSNNEETSSDESNELESCENSQLSEYSSLSEENIYAIIKNFPVQIICLEKMDNTLDSLLDNEGNNKTNNLELSNKEWSSCLFQIIMILITYQKIFDFTHNDLHTNNIMFQKTDRKFINYKYNNIYYRVPTFGRIYKIIDFGRAIYSFNGKTICSDSYHPKGDAATQYNFEPYFNEKKPRLKPNKSFDLCRLACSLYDFFVDDIENENKIKNPIAKLIIKWTKDDKGRNILYKNNGEERYPDFKLYKMIVRTVHQHVPENELSNSLFSQYKSSKKKIKKGKIINIDKMEPMI